MATLWLKSRGRKAEINRRFIRLSLRLKLSSHIADSQFRSAIPYASDPLVVVGVRSSSGYTGIKGNSALLNRIAQLLAKEKTSERSIK